MANIAFEDRGGGGFNWQDLPPTYGFHPPAPPQKAPDYGSPQERQALAAQHQTPEDLLKNYWAPDWREVFASPSRWGSNAPQAAPSPFNIGSFGSGWVGSGGRTLNDWLNYYHSHPEAGQAGAKLSGSKQDKLEYGGRIYDMVQSAGMGGLGATFNDVTNPQPMAPMQSSYAAQFSDPSTKQLEEYVQQLIGQLKQPAFSGPEAEVMRTRALEPIENDRAAAKYRALNNIGARGLDPSSGIAQELLNQVDRGFDTSRAQAQNDLAYRTIGQNRTNQNDVLSLLQLLYQLPRNSMQDALAVINGGPNYSSLMNGYTQLGALNAQNSAANGSWLGQLMAYLLR